MEKRKNKIITWKGKPIEELSKEELIEALHIATSMYEEIAEWEWKPQLK